MMSHKSKNKKHQYSSTITELAKASDPVAPYEVVAAGREIVKGYTLDEAKAFINKRFKELYRVNYDAI